MPSPSLPGSKVRGLLYWLITAGPVAAVVGRMRRANVSDRNGPLTLPQDADWRLVSAIRFNVYEYPERVLIRKYLPVGVDCIELGASLGIVSREILSKLDDQRRFISVEALPGLHMIARKNINSFAPNREILLRQGAIHYGGSKARFCVGLTNLAGRVDQDANGSEMIEVPAIALSDILREAGFSDYSLVLDIEGAEYQILEHDLNALRRCRCLIAELHGQESDRDRFCRAMAGLGLALVERKHSVYAFLREGIGTK